MQTADRAWVTEVYGPKVAGNDLLLEHQSRRPVRSGYRLTEANLG